MATTYRAHSGITKGHHAGVVRDVAVLVSKAAAGVSWNLLGAAPKGFEMTDDGDGALAPIHSGTGIRFKPGFFMTQVAGSQKWESKANTEEYRLDLQSIENNRANWAIQTNGKNSKTVATCLMEVNKGFSQGQLIHGLTQSAARGELCELTENIKKTKK